jgi:hypothetical protein
MHDLAYQVMHGIWSDESRLTPLLVVAPGRPGDITGG